MRYCISLIFGLCLSFCCSAQNGEEGDGGRIKMIWAEVQDVIDRNSKPNIPDSLKWLKLYEKLKTVIREQPADEKNLSLISYWGVNLSYQQIDYLLQQLDSSVYASPYMAAVRVTMKRITVAETGRPFPEVILSDSSGNELHLSDLKGKIVLIDIWSSWCSPCREQIPELKKMYSRYQKKGFEIIGISIDDEKEKWQKALKSEKQPWKEFCELISWPQNQFAKRFNIYSIPANFLITRDGILAEQNLSVEAIKTWLEQHNE